MTMYPPTPYETVGVKVGKYILQRFSENYLKDEDIEVIFQALLNIYHRLARKKVVKVSFCALCLVHALLFHNN